MYEVDYLILAQKKSEKEIMDEHWKKVAKTKTWVSLDETETKFSDLELGHLMNILVGLLDFKNENVKLIIKELVNELRIRLNKKTPAYVKEAIDEIVSIARYSNSDKKILDTINDDYTVIREKLY